MPQKDINTVFVELTTTQQAKVPAQYIFTTKGNVNNAKKVVMISDLKGFASMLAGENLLYSDLSASQFNTVPVAANLPYDELVSKLYHVVPQQFVTNYKGFKDAANELNARQTTDGRWVCAFNTLYEFWDFFGGQTIQLVMLEITDFPAPPPRF